jgi:hypothetical protein
VTTLVFASLAAEVLPALIQAPLRAPRDLDDAWILPCLAAGELVADAWLVAVVVGSLDRQPACVRWPGFGDRSLPSAGVGGVLAGHDPEEPGQQAGLGEPLEAADVGADPGGGQRVDPAEAP